MRLNPRGRALLVRRDVMALVGCIALSVLLVATAPTAPVSAVLMPGTRSVPLPVAEYPTPIIIEGATSVHDPSVIRRPDGTYLVAGTGDNIPLKTSSDRISFRDAGVAFPDGAPWTAGYTAGGAGLWAPDLSFHGGQFYLYYSASTFGSQRSAIFLATSPTGDAGSWTHRGLVVETAPGSDWNAIDPNLLVTDEGWYLSAGSFWSGIKQFRLTPGTGMLADPSFTDIASRGGGPIEAPLVVKRGSFYYLWVSFDLCCRGANSTYRTMVGRSTSPQGPFLDRLGVDLRSGGGTQVLAGHGNVHGPGHVSVFADADRDVLAYHYYDATGVPRLGLNVLDYDADGWPYLR